MRQIRDHFRKQRQLPRPDAIVCGYWRRHMTSTQYDEQRHALFQQAIARNVPVAASDEFDEEPL